MYIIISGGIWSVQEYYYSVCDNWMFNHSGRKRTIHDIPDICGHTFPKTMSSINIQPEFHDAETPITSGYTPNVSTIIQED